MTVLFCANRKKDEGLTKSLEIINFLKSKNIVVYGENELIKELNKDYIFNLDSLYDLKDNIDFILILGGDGTILKYVYKYVYIDAPILAINLGRVGAMTGASLDDYQEKIIEIINGKFYVEERNIIECSFANENITAYNDYHKIIDNKIKEICLNDVVIHRTNIRKLLSISLSVINSNSERNNRIRFYADGVIIATTMGSSAYNLSCGGPLLLSGTNCFVVTPIAPQYKSMCSFVASDNEVLSIYVNNIDNNTDKFFITIDGNRIYELSDSVIDINKSDKKVKYIKFNNKSSLFDPYIKVISSNKLIDVKEDNNGLQEK